MTSCASRTSTRAPDPRLCRGSRLLRTLLLWLALAALAVPATPALAALGPAQLGLVINDADPSSVEVGEYYRRARNIPDSNIVHVRLADRPRKLSAEQF